MSTAIDYLDVGIEQNVSIKYVPSNFVSSQSAAESSATGRKSDFIGIKPDIRRSVLTASILKTSPVYITRGFLREAAALAGHTKGLAKSPFKFRILRSEHEHCFSLGGDLSFFRESIRTGDKAALEDYATAAAQMIFDNCSGNGYRDLVTISLVRAQAQGGGFEAALSSHVLVAEQGVRFGFPEGLFGMFPGMGASELLTNRCGSSIAKEIISSTRQWSAEELFEVGVVDALAEPGCGDELVRSITGQKYSLDLGECRSRFSNISIDDLYHSIQRWVNQAMKLTPRDLRTIDLLLQAQSRSFGKNITPDCGQEAS